MGDGRLRILHTESSLGWGGQEIRILTEARGMIDRGHHVALACPPEAKIHAQAPKYGVPVTALPIGRKRPEGLRALRGYLASRRIAIDVVNTHSSTDSWLAAIACSTLGNAPRVVRTRHLSTAVDPSPFTRWLYLRASRHVVTTGERIREQLHRDNGYPLDHMTSVPTGIDLTRYRPGDRGAARRALGLADRPTLGIVATLRGWKGHKELLDAWTGLRTRFPLWQLAIVGDGPQWENLNERIAVERLGEAVTMAGNRDDVERWLQALDLFVLPSWGNEGVPQGILQAMATALPVVSTTVGAIDEAVVEGATGYLVEPRNAPALQERLAALMDDAALRERLGAAGHARAQSAFGLAVMLDRMEGVFRAACAGRPVADREDPPRRHVAFPYNEILPKRTAHDVYLFRTAASLAQAGGRVSLLHGAGSPDLGHLHAHYRTDPEARLLAVRLPIVRRNFRPRITINAVFHWAAQRWIARHRPDWVVLSVLKQGDFHLGRRVPGVRYAYEVHELGWYPGRDAGESAIARRVATERRMLSRADLVVTTTGALRDILQAEPYAVRTRIEVLALAADSAPLPAAQTPDAPLRLAYVGQLYREQGVELLLEALSRVAGPELEVVGGKPDEIAALEGLARRLAIGERVRWHGFVPPAAIAGHAARAGAFVAPFLAEGRMPHVAHTKLLDYIGWQRPVIAPDLPVVREHFDSGGVLYFRAGDADSLAQAIALAAAPGTLARLTGEIRRNGACHDARARGVRLLALLDG